MKQHFWLKYGGVLSVLGAIIAFSVWQGIELHPAKLEKVASSASGWETFVMQLAEAVKSPLSILILQLLTILAAVRVVSWLMRLIGQPAVIGEIIAGIILGPSLVGYYFPEFSAFLFGKDTMTTLKMLSQLGLILFMFIIGMELDMGVLRNKAQTALMVSHFSIVFMHAVGVGLAFLMYEQFGGERADFLNFAWFLGVAMSITAFPVLARIIQERNLNKTALGMITITCAAADDVTAWSILAALIAWVKAGSLSSAVYTLLGFGVYLWFMLKVLQPFLKRVAEIYVSREVINKAVVGMFFLLLFSSAYITELMGIHALFGAFLAGVIMPQRTDFKEILTQKIEDVSSVLLLPLFFAYTGLRTQIGLLNSVELWLWAGFVVLVASVGKSMAVALSARFLGMKGKDALLLGVLMNTRGLMELIVLNIGYDLGILSPQMFAIMVIMALATTFMTVPLLDLIEFLYKKAAPKPKPSANNAVFLSFGLPQMGVSLLKIARLISRQPYKITALHLTPQTDLSPQQAAEFERESFEPLLETAAELNLKVETVYKASDKISTTISQTATEKQAQMLLLGSAKSIFSQDATGGIIRQVLEMQSCPAAVLIDKGLEEIKAVLILVMSEKDNYLLDIAAQIQENISIAIRVLDNLNKSGKKHPFIQKNPNLLLQNTLFATALIKQYDLIIVGFEYWDNNPDDYEQWKNDSPSILIMRPAVVETE